MLSSNKRVSVDSENYWSNRWSRISQDQSRGKDNLFWRNLNQWKKGMWSENDSIPNSKFHHAPKAETIPLPPSSWYSHLLPQTKEIFPLSFLSSGYESDSSENLSVESEDDLVEEEACDISKNIWMDVQERRRRKEDDDYLQSFSVCMTCESYVCKLCDHFMLLVDGYYICETLVMFGNDDWEQCQVGENHLHQDYIHSHPMVKLIQPDVKGNVSENSSKLGCKTCEQGRRKQHKKSNSKLNLQNEISSPRMERPSQPMIQVRKFSSRYYNNIIQPASRSWRRRT